MTDPAAASPACMSPDEFRRLGHRVVDWIADYRARAASLPVQSRVDPGALLAALPASPPEHAEGFDAVLRDLDALLLPALSHWQHPRFFAYFPSNGDLASVLGDFLSSGLGALGLAWQSAPALTELEQRVTDWLAELLGLDPGWRGVIQDTASTSTFLALVCARERTTSHGAARTGMQHGESPACVYTSADAHASVEKAALLAGFGREHVRRIAVDAQRALDAQALARALAADHAAGLRPCAIVATTGTTATTALDPLRACAALARQHGAWLHVDAAMAGSAMLLPECRQAWDGVELADSLVVNPHKWLGAVFDCSVFWVRDDEHLVRALGTNPSYLRTAVDDRVRNYRDWGIALGRRFRALKLWSLIRTHGAEALRARLRRDLANARWLADQLAASPPWRLLAPVPLQTLVVRHEPPRVHGDDLDRHTLGWLERVHATGRAWLTPVQLDGRWAVRVSIGALTTEREHVEELWRLLQDAVRGPERERGAQDRI
jgi:aromatic-L-amino-acid decarboxylase